MDPINNKYRESKDCKSFSSLVFNDIRFVIFIYSWFVFIEFGLKTILLLFLLRLFLKKIEPIHLTTLTAVCFRL